MSRTNRPAPRPRTVLSVEALEARTNPGAGGGFTDGGLLGEYFPNSSLTGPASFARRDVRIEFDWGTQAPGGSLSPQYQAVGADQFSARWTGQLVPTFSETYTFETRADDGIRVYLKPEGATAWAAVIDNWPPSGQPATGRAKTGTAALTAGQRYDIRVEYREFGGRAVAELRWSSPSTPKEVIEPLSVNGYHVDGRGYYMFADAMKTARSRWDSPATGVPAPAVDAAGNPLGDGALYFWEGANSPYFAGVYNVRFQGQANVSGFQVRFRRLGTTTDVSSLSAADVYNPATNTSEFQMVVGTTNNSPAALRLTATKRQPADAPGTGVTGIEMMRPRTIGGTDPYPYGTLYTDAFKQAADVFTSYRWLDVNGTLTETEWAQRTRPGFERATGGGHPDDGVANKGWTYEYQIMFANETGKDLHLTLPALASNDYFLNLARLVRYGSRADGTPAAGPTDPLRVYPGLNPNLKVYVELSNEVWNTAGAFNQTRQLDDAAVAAFQAPAGSALRAEWDVANYDGTVSTADANGFNSYDFKRIGRWYALRTVRMSEQFRAVYGAEVGDDVRPLMFWQYNNANGFALHELKFLDDYFNNGDGNPTGQARPAPRPLSYYLWGAGGASYYGSGNSRGTLAVDPVVNPSFDQVGTGSPLPLDQATLRPTTVTGWSFAGNAGVYGRATGSPTPTYTSDGRSLGQLPAPAAGDYAAYVMRGGGLSTTLTLTQPGRYAIGFTARGSHSIPLDFTLDGQRVTPQYLPYYGVGEADPATGFAPISYSWNTNFGAGWDADLTTATVAIEVPAGGRAVTFSVAAQDITAAPGTDAYNSQIAQYLLFDTFYVGSVDRLFAGGVPNGGQALGQVNTGTWTQDRNEIAQYAQAYGLKPASYESGWSLGGDNGASPLQNWAKYRDPRAKIANDTAIDIHSRAGYGLVVYGVYEQWRDRDLATAAESELMKSFAAKADQLPAAPANGLPVPLTLTQANQTLSYSGSGTSFSFSRGANSAFATSEWMAWNVIVPAAGTYTVSAVTAGTGGVVRLTVDETTVVGTGASGGTVSGNLFLTAGLHTVKVRATAGSFTFDRVDVAGASAPASPTVTAATAGSGSAALTWGAVAGATGYRVRWGTAPGVYTNEAVVTGTTHTVTGLASGTPYYFVVGARNASGESLPSAPRSVIPVPPAGQTGTLAVWEMNAAGVKGREASAPPVATSSQATVGGLTRGSGYAPADGYWQDVGAPYRLSSHPTAVGRTFAATLADAIARNAYYEFTVAAVPGRTLSLDTLGFQAWFSNTTGARVGVTVGTNGTFTEVAAAGTPNSAAGYTVALTGTPAVQGTTAPVTVRIYLYGATAGTAVGIGLGSSAADLTLTGGVS